MNVRFIAAVFAASAAFLWSCTDVKAPPPPDAARVVTFSADKTQVAPGETVTLSFQTANGSEVEIIDDQGRGIELLGDVNAGTAVVAPARTSFYVLRVNGVGGRDSAFVQIAVGEAARELFLISVPEEVASGESAQLLWGAQGATTVTLQTGDETPVALTGGTGTVTVTPARSERFTLSASSGAGQPTQTAITEVRVRPLLLTFNLEAPNGLEAGQAVTLRWTSRGGQRLVLREATFGQLLDQTDLTLVDDGSTTWTVPATLPNGLPVQQGVPLRFEATLTSNSSSVVKTIAGVVGDAPLIERVTAPEAASLGRPFTLSWNTLNAARVAVEAEGQVLFETLPSERARAEAGSVSLPTPAVQTTYTVVATNDRGVTARASVMVRPVTFPIITNFELTPPTINAPGDTVTATWSAMNARRIQLRVANGPTIAVNSTMPNNGTLTFRAGGAQTFVLEAFNEAGDKAEATDMLAMVGAPVVSVSPTPTLAGNMATLNWALDALGVTEVVGLPTPVVATTGSANFVDLTQDPNAIEAIFANRADGASEIVPPAGFHPVMLGIERPRLWVSVNGFIAFAAPAALPTNSDFEATGNTAPLMLAPFWDDLTLASTSKVLTALGPPTPNGERRFIVQWDKVLQGTTEVTFQVQLTESGTVTYVYGALNGATGSTATIGIKDTDFIEVHSFNAASVTDGAELAFFSGALPTGMLSFTANTSRLISFFGRTATGVIPFVAPLVALNQGDLTLSEAMPSPEASVASTGQWVEVRNNTDVPINLNGLTLTSTGSTPDGGHLFGDVVVPPRGYVVAGQSTNATDNGGANVTVVLNDVPLSAGADTLSLTLEGVAIDTLSWPVAVEGRSIQLSEGLLLGSGGGTTPLCTSATQTFGPNGAIGTPGAANEPCSPYRIDRIPGAFVELGGVGDVELLGTASDYSGYGDVNLPVPFTYYGQPYSSISVSMTGFFTFGSSLTAAYNATNDVLPNTGAPNGVVAPFWDEIVREATPGRIYMRRGSDRTIVSWQTFRIYAMSGSLLHFQVHLIDTGVIEFHYGPFTPTTAASELRLAGSSATVWLETPSGGSAVAVGVNTAGTVSQNSGIRFTP